MACRSGSQQLGHQRSRKRRILGHRGMGEVKKKGEAAIEKWIDAQLVGTSVTVVLIGAETASRPYVGYEIKASHNKGNGILGIYVHNMKDVNSKTDVKGNNPFAN